jgi:hypothetical protein
MLNPVEEELFMFQNGESHTDAAAGIIKLHPSSYHFVEALSVSKNNHNTFGIQFMMILCTDDRFNDM